MHTSPEAMQILVHERLARIHAEARSRHLLADARRALAASLAPILRRKPAPRPLERTLNA